ncbi:hypothetical protein [Ruegeria arenilitoris]|uniref:hypothetical protein n=1 Tax=Ruegeria arenilitoris TaxID=1173585 RepID=UPI00147B8B96|nr:hypothetical protein [Ruegeria arenilitoris]
MPNTPACERFSTGDLVAFDFPFSDGGAKTRVCLIVADDPGLHEVVVAYGTTNLRLNHDRRNAVILNSQSDWSAAGLHRATRFQVDRRIRVSMTDMRFKQNRSLGTAKVGRLLPGRIQQLMTCYSRLKPVSFAQERLGIHPKPQVHNGRRSFLGRRPVRHNAGSAAA